jgi:hypothetical protein
VATVATVLVVQWLQYTSYSTVATVATVLAVQWLQYTSYSTLATVATVLASLPKLSRFAQSWSKTCRLDNNIFPTDNPTDNQILSVGTVSRLKTVPTDQIRSSGTPIFHRFFTFYKMFQRTFL